MNSEVSDKIQQHFSQYRSRRYKKGHILIYAGDAVEHIYQLDSGVVKQYDISYRGDEVVLNMFKSPAFFPMSHVINKTLAKYIFEAETDIEVRQAPAGECLDFLKKNPDVLYDLLSRVYAGAEGLLGRMAHLMTSNAKSRLMYELILEARRFGVPQADGSCILTLTEKDLGSRAGLSRETVNRELHKLKAEQLITISRSSIHIPDMIALEKSLGHEV